MARIQNKLLSESAWLRDLAYAALAVAGPTHAYSIEVHLNYVDGDAPEDHESMVEALGAIMTTLFASFINDIVNRVRSSRPKGWARLPKPE